MVERDLALAAYERQPLHLLHLSARESVRGAPARAQPRACRRPAEVTPHHLCLTDEAVRSLDPNLKMNPPLRAPVGPHGADRRAEGRNDHRDRHRPRAARAAREGRPVRGGAVRRHRPRDGVRRALHAPRRAGRSSRSRRCSSACRPGPARVYGLRAAAHRGRSAGEPRPARPERELTASREDGFRSRSANSWLLGETLKGKVRATIAAGRLAYSA